VRDIPSGAWAAGVAAAGLAIALHGLVDSFISFTPTYVLISIVLGLAVACGRAGTTAELR
jgi:hypothetical protein